MIINRHNYEEYFLLYADAELSAADRQMVDDFVVRHADLAEELQLLLCTVLPTPPAATIMPSKAGLLKPELWDAEHLTPLQTNLLLQLDGEVPYTLPTSPAHDPHTQLEWQYLTKARLAPEPLEMPNKAVLYHTDDDDVRIVPMYWIRRLAVAAAILGLGWFIGSKMMATNSTPTPNGTLATTIPTPTIQPENSTLPTPVSDGQSSNAAIAVSEKNAPANAVKMLPAADKKDNIKPETPTQLPVVLAQNANNLPERPLANTTELAANGIGNSEMPTLPPTGITAEKSGNALSNPIENTTNQAKPMAQQVVYNEEPDTEEYVYIGGAKIKKQKVRGVFRTVGRTLGRTLEKNTIAQVVPETANLR